MRNFLTDINIVGAMLVSRCGGILNYSIPNLLKWCDWILIMLDNENEETLKIVNEYVKKFPGRIRVAYTGFPHATEKQEEEVRGLFHRFKPLQGPIRETVFQYMRDIEKQGENVDILIWPDSDEIFSDSLPDLLEEFWAMPDKKAITMKPVDVFGDMTTIHSRSMTGHTRIFKFFPELTAIPYRTACNHRPLTKQNRMGDVRTTIHLCSLTNNKRDWRNIHWKPNIGSQEALWKLPKDIRRMTPDELRDILHSEPDLTVDEYLRGGDKRMPVGTENASKAMQEAKEMLDEMGIRNYLAFGTCLGIKRDKKLIKWDWDVDFIILAEDLINFKVDIVYEKGFTEVKLKRDLPRVKTEKGEVSEDLAIRTISFKKYGVRIDLDPAYLDEDGVHRVILKGRKRQKFCAKHPKEWFETPEIVEYRGMKYSLPSPVDEYLASNYGEDWHKPAYGPTPWSKRKCMSQFYACKKK